MQQGQKWDCTVFAINQQIPVLCPFSSYSTHCSLSTEERRCAGEGESHLGCCPVNPALCTWINVNKNESLHQVRVAELWGESTGTLRRMIQPTHWSTAGAAAGKLLAKGRQNKMKTKWGAPVLGSQWPFQSLAQSWLPARPYSIKLLALRDWLLTQHLQPEQVSAASSGAAAGPAQAPMYYRAASSDSLSPVWHLQEGPGQTPVPREHLPPLLKEEAVSQWRCGKMARFGKWHGSWCSGPAWPTAWAEAWEAPAAGAPGSPEGTPAAPPSPAPAWHPQHPAIYLGVCMWGARVQNTLRTACKHKPSNLTQPENFEL